MVEEKSPVILRQHVVRFYFGVEGLRGLLTGSRQAGFSPRDAAGHLFYVP